MPLTDAAIRNAKPTDKPYLYIFRKIISERFSENFVRNIILLQDVGRDTHDDLLGISEDFRTGIIVFSKNILYKLLASMLTI